MTAAKRCPRCGQLKSAEEFYRRRHGQHLSSSYCRLCTRAASCEARSRRRQDPTSALALQAVDRTRQRRHRTLRRQGGDSR